MTEHDCLPGDVASNVPPTRSAGQGEANTASAADVPSLQSALDGWQRARQAQRLSVDPTDDPTRLEQLESRLREAVDQLAAVKSQSHAAQLHLQSELEAARRRADDAQAALERASIVTGELRVANSDLTTALESAQRRLSEAQDQIRASAEAPARSDPPRNPVDPAASDREHAAAARVVELERDRDALRFRIDEMSAVTTQLERECNRLRAERASGDEPRRLKAETARLEAKIVEIERQRSEAVQRHSAAVAGYMVELNQRAEALQAREAELRRVTDELADARRSYEDAAAEVAVRAQAQVELERQVGELRVAARTETAVERAPVKSAPPPPAAPPREEKPLSLSVSSKQTHLGGTADAPLTIIHLEDDEAIRQVVRNTTAGLAGVRYCTAIESAQTVGSRIVAINLLNRTIEPLAIMASLLQPAADHENVLVYCAEDGYGFSFGLADFFSADPLDAEACVEHLLESCGAIQRMLVASDNFALVCSLREVLSRMRSSTASALDLRQVLEVLPMAEPDVVLIDLELPRGEGFQLVSRLRADPTTHDLPLGVMLAPSTDPSRFRQQAMRAARSLTFTLDGLVADVRQRLGALACVPLSHEATERAVGGGR